MFHSLIVFKIIKTKPLNACTFTISITAMRERRKINQLINLKKKKGKEENQGQVQ
jgi:hypothetical protein